MFALNLNEEKREIQFSQPYYFYTTIDRTYIKTGETTENGEVVYLYSPKPYRTLEHSNLEFNAIFSHSEKGVAHYFTYGLNFSPDLITNNGLRKVKIITRYLFDYVFLGGEFLQGVFNMKFYFHEAGIYTSTRNNTLKICLKKLSKTGTVTELTSRTITKNYSNAAGNTNGQPVDFNLYITNKLFFDDGDMLYIETEYTGSNFVTSGRNGVDTGYFIFKNNGGNPAAVYLPLHTF